MTELQAAHDAEHTFARVHGFYRVQLWWIDSFTIRRGNWYRYHISGRNDMRDGEPMHWAIPTIIDRPHAFRLREVA